MQTTKRVFAFDGKEMRETSIIEARSRGFYYADSEDELIEILKASNKRADFLFDGGIMLLYKILLNNYLKIFKIYFAHISESIKSIIRCLVFILGHLNNIFYSIVMEIIVGRYYKKYREYKNIQKLLKSREDDSSVQK